MIIGNGMIAKQFNKHEYNDSVIIFSSGVSNSKETRKKEFLREEELLILNLRRYKQQKFIYFGTCSIYDLSAKDTMYVQHKIKMENLIKRYHNDFIIFRLPQVVGKTTNQTIINFLFNKIFLQENFELWTKSTRNLIDVEDVFKIAEFIIKNQLFKNEIVNIASPFSVYINEIVEIIEELTRKKAHYEVLNKGTEYKIDISKIVDIIRIVGIKFDNNYIKNIIYKYYSNTKVY